MRKTFTSIVVCLLLTVAVHAQTRVAGNTALETALQLKLDEWHKAGTFPGATLGVVLANGQSFGLAVGFSDREAKTPMKPTDRMLAGSVGKTFAAATALQLIKEARSASTTRSKSTSDVNHGFRACRMRKTSQCGS